MKKISVSRFFSNMRTAERSSEYYNHSECFHVVVDYFGNEFDMSKLAPAIEKHMKRRFRQVRKLH